MKYIKMIDLFLILLVFWFLLTLNFNTLNIIIGVLISFVISIISYGIIYQDSIHLKRIKPLLLLIYMFFLLIHIYKSSFSYIIKMFSPNCQPSILEIDIDIENPFIISTIANSITLTPGTITVDYKDKKLRVLALCESECDQEKIKESIKNDFIKHFLNKGQ